MRKLKIAILHSSDLKKVSPGGITQYVQKIILTNMGDEITVFGTCEANSDKYKIGQTYDEEINGNKYKFIPICTNKKRPISVFYFFNLLKILSSLKKYDIIFAQRMEYALPFIKKNSNLVLAVHGSGKYAYLFWGYFIGTIYNYFERLAIRNSNKVIVLLNREEFGVPYYKKKYKKYQEKILYGKVPVDTNVFQVLNKDKIKEELGFNKENKVLLFFGRIEENPKRIMLLPLIAQKIKENISDFVFLVIGSGNDKNKLCDKVQELNLQDHFLFIDSLEHGTKLVEYINCADISFILSSFEGICMSALESLACGVPVISTDVGDIKQYISNNNNGWIVPNNDRDSIVINVAEIIINYYSQDRNINVDEKYKEYSLSSWKVELDKIFDEVIK